MYKLIGGELSPYTAKVRCYLRYKNIPFEPVQASAEIYSQFIKPKVGINVIPILVTPQNHVIQDSNEIITSLEKWHPQSSIIPRTPKQRIVSLLLELFCDEWMVLPIMHYRWSFEENSPFLSEEFGRVAFPRESLENRHKAASMVYGRFKSMLAILGITEKTAPAIEKSWKAMLYDLTVHFDAHPYLLGGKPCIGDFSLAGMTYAHLYRDPVPGYLMKTTAPLVAAWVEHMNGQLLHSNKLALHHVDEDGNIVRDPLPPEATEFCQNDDIPETLYPILRRFFTEFAPVLLTTKDHLTRFIEENVKPGSSTKLPRNLGLQEFTIDGVSEKKGTFSFHMWKWQFITDFYQSLSLQHQREVDEFLKQFPHGLDIAKANLDLCRVTRIKNILHADLNAKSKL